MLSSPISNLAIDSSRAVLAKKAQDTYNAAASGASRASAEATRFIGQNGDAISTGLSVIALGVCIGVAAACGGVAIASGIVGAVTAGVQSYEKHGDWRRAGAQALASVGVSAIGFGAGKVIGKIAAVGRAGDIFGDMNAFPLELALSLSVDDGVDMLFDR